MRIELPQDGGAGNWVDIRDRLLGRDKTAVLRAITFTMGDGKAQQMNAAVQVEMQNALLANIITAWSFDRPIPSVSGGVDAVEDLDIDDLNVLVEKTADLLKKVSFKVPN